MGAATPFELGQLLHASDETAREAAWDALISAHTRIILGVARSFGGDRDDAMERYSYVVEKLRERDFQRLRAYRDEGPARFSTWLTVTVRRLCLDHHRTLYGRVDARLESDEIAMRRLNRRRLADSIAAELETDLLEDQSAVPADIVEVYATRDNCLYAAVARLSTRDQLLLTLRFHDGLSASQIKSVLGMPTAFHVYRRLKLVLRELRSMLEAQGIDGVDG